MIPYIKTTYFFGLTILLLAVLMACNTDKDTVTEPNGRKGTLIIRLTDAPFPIDLVEEANVTISKIEIRHDTVDTGTPFLTLSEETMTFDLLDLQNEVTAVLVNASIPVGGYNLVRLFVSEASILLKDGVAFDMKVPSGAETGIKLFVKPAIEIVDGSTAELLLDFDVSKSFIVKGNPNTPAGIQGFNFKPVIRAVNLSSAGKITGVVTDTSSQAMMGAAIWIEQDSVISTSFTREDGKYALLGIPSGSYTIKATSVGHDTVSVEMDIAASVQVITDFKLTTKAEN